MILILNKSNLTTNLSKLNHAKQLINETIKLITKWMNCGSQKTPGPQKATDKNVNHRKLTTAEQNGSEMNEMWIKRPLDHRRPQTPT